MQKKQKVANIITLRNLPEEVLKTVKKKAFEKKLSLNKAVISLLLESLSWGKKEHLYHDLDHLSGSWTKAEAFNFDKKLVKQRKIDFELWQ